MQFDFCLSCIFISNMQFLFFLNCIFISNVQRMCAVRPTSLPTTSKPLPHEGRNLGFGVASPCVHHANGLIMTIKVFQIWDPPNIILSWTHVRDEQNYSRSLLRTRSPYHGKR